MGTPPESRHSQTIHMQRTDSRTCPTAVVRRAFFPWGKFTGVAGGAISSAIRSCRFSGCIPSESRDAGSTGGRAGDSFSGARQQDCAAAFLQQPHATPAETAPQSPRIGATQPRASAMAANMRTSLEIAVCIPLTLVNPAGAMFKAIVPAELPRDACRPASHVGLWLRCVRPAALHAPNESGNNETLHTHRRCTSADGIARGFA